MIGGSDVVFSKRTEPLDRIVIAQTLWKRWPGLVVQDGAAEDAIGFAEALGIIASSDEFFVYRDAASFKSWSEHGAQPEHEDQMVHIIVAPDEVTFVVAGPGSETDRMAQEAIRALSVAETQDIRQLLVSGQPMVVDEPHSKDRAVTNGSRQAPREELAA
jgi:hypothetical protein